MREKLKWLFKKLSGQHLNKRDRAAMQQCKDDFDCFTDNVKVLVRNDFIKRFQQHINSYPNSYFIQAAPKHFNFKGR